MLGRRDPLPDLMLYDGVSSSELGRDLVRYGAVRKVLEETLVWKILNIVIDTYSKEIKDQFTTCVASYTEACNLHTETHTYTDTSNTNIIKYEMFQNIS
jgi:hypothetical protein